ncbi:Hpt domain-containing protein [Pseudidiomarina planktonica]|uniref:Hpt domain-containing protein n=1 Tax=Pseudidiomarina planktonica TaxID=1323738 RepID=A0A1Y6EFD1_9GAMM|nr:Hpt domain-containing protein [Pseudidiomarina planktonica]RUO66004.1 histidine kinase [Pseudidiomarina planktonica]SMQ61166.1 Hpt domain-containing protein [Pseudidiomarina planktonica]
MTTGNSIALDEVLLGQYADALGLDGLQHTVNIFIQIMPSYMEELTEAADNKDTAAVRSQAHKMKSACRSVGLAGLARKLEYLEKESWQPSDLPALLKDFDSAYEKATPVLQEWLQNYNQS